MSGKNQYPVVLGPSAPIGQQNSPGMSWQTTSPVIGFLPQNNQQGSSPSGILQGVMSG